MCSPLAGFWGDSSFRSAVFDPSRLDPKNVFSGWFPASVEDLLFQEGFYLGIPDVGKASNPERWREVFIKLTCTDSGPFLKL